MKLELNSFSYFFKQNFQEQTCYILWLSIRTMKLISEQVIPPARASDNKNGEYAA